MELASNLSRGRAQPHRRDLLRSFSPSPPSPRLLLPPPSTRDNSFPFTSLPPMSQPRITPGVGQDEDFLHYTVTTFPPSLHSITKSSGTLVHTDSAKIIRHITTNLPNLLSSASTCTSSSLPKLDAKQHNFTSILQTGTSKSRKPIRESFSYSLLLETDPTNTAITITSTTDSPLNPVSISGLVTLIPSDFGTTEVVLSATLGAVNNSPQDAAASSPSGKAQRRVVTQQAHPLDHLLSLIPTLHHRFARYSAVDRALFAAFEHTVSHNPPPITPQEDALVTSSIKADDMDVEFERNAALRHLNMDAGPRGWKRFPGTVRDTVSYFQKKEKNDVWGKAVATVDAPASTVFASMFCQDNYESARNHVKKEGKGTLRKVVTVPNSRTMLVAAFVRLSPYGIAVSNRVACTRFSWRREPDDSFVIAFAPLDEYEDKERVKELNDAVANDALAANAIRTEARGFWIFKPLAPVVCEVTYFLQVKMGGSIPKQLIAMRTRLTLSSVQATQDDFERNGKVVDAEMFAAFSPPPPLAELNDDQKLVVESCRYLESEDGREWDPLPSSSPFVDMWCKHTLAKRGERSIALGKATAGENENSVQSADFVPLFPLPRDELTNGAFCCRFFAHAPNDALHACKQLCPLSTLVGGRAFCSHVCGALSLLAHRRALCSHLLIVPTPLPSPPTPLFTHVSGSHRLFGA